MTKKVCTTTPGGNVMVNLRVLWTSSQFTLVVGLPAAFKAVIKTFFIFVATSPKDGYNPSVILISRRSIRSVPGVVVLSTHAM